MLKLLKEFKQYKLSLVIIIVLLLIQANADLALPDYMSKIVNIGIQQNGIENAVPKAIRKTELEKLKFFMNENEVSLLESSYNLIDKSNLTEKEYNKHLKEYPQLQNEEIYILDISKEDIQQLEKVMSKPLLIVFQINDKKNIPFEIPEGLDVFQIIGQMSELERKEILSTIEAEIGKLPDAMISQAAIKSVKSEYESIGIDSGKVQTNYIIRIGGIMLGISFLNMSAAIAIGFLASKLSAKLGLSLRERVFKKVASFSNSEFDDFSTASLITRSTNDIQQIQTFSIMMVRIVFFAPIMAIGGITRALRTNTSMAWIIAIGVMAIMTLIVILFSFALPKFKKLQSLVDKLNLVTREFLNGLMVVRAFNTQKSEEKKFIKANKELTDVNLFVARIMVTMMPSMTIIMNAITLLIVWIGAKEINQGTIQVGDMMAFMQYTMQIIMSFVMISMVSFILPRAVVSAQRVYEVLDKDLTIVETSNPKSFPQSSKGVIEFNDVSFRYPGAEEDVLENISFTAKPGEVTAFIGSTGSGKSTLINLIPRFYDVTNGEILIDNINIKDVKLKELRDKIGYVPQKGVLFTGDIESNISYGKNKDATKEEIFEAIEISQAKEFIETKEKGIKTEISQGGTNVSGGQRQRLSIARALAKKPEILIFDDSFSALDFKTDAKLRNAINEKVKNRTVLIVAQRINTIMNAENIIVIDEGKIVGKGNHKDLLTNCSVYKQIALSQLSEEELSI